MKSRVFILLLLLCAFALGIKSFSEPDLWWQIRTGEWILDHGAIPHTDVFSYTYAGTQWINIKWGFEVLAALVSRAMGPECVYLIQACVSVLIFFFLFRWAKAFPVPLGSTPYAAFSISTGFVFAAFAVGYRINGRPEMFSHLFTVLFLYILSRQRQKASMQLFLLVPLQSAWANLHEAYAMGIVLLTLFTAGAWLEKAMHTERDGKYAQRLTWVLLLSFLSIVINPNGTALWLRPLDIFRQVGENKFTTELLSFTDVQYWSFQAWLALFMLAFVLLAEFSSWKKNRKDKDGGSLQRLGTGYTLVVMALLYLALTAQRNIVFLVLALFPAFVHAVHYYITPKLKLPQARLLAWALPLILYLLIVSNAWYELTGSRTRFGLEVTSYNNPTGVASFIQEKGLQKKRCFSDYLTSSYLLWKLQPDFKTFIDLRDLDVFPPEHFQKFIQAAYVPGTFNSLDSLYHFDYVVLFRPAFDNLHGYLYNDSIYACTYVDAVAAVYEKTDEFTREDIFSACKRIKSSVIANAVNHVLNPFYQPYNYRDIDYDRIAAAYYTVVSQPKLARERGEKSAQRH